MSIMQITQTVHIMPTFAPKRAKRIAQPTLPGMGIETVEAPKITNRQIAEVLSSIADILVGQNSNQYRIQAYRNAARGVLNLQEPAIDILARHEALPIPGLGERLRKRITELVELGSMTINNGFCMETLPHGVRVLMAVEHIGPYTAIRLHQDLGIDSIEALWDAANQHLIRQLPGFGPRSESRLKTAAEHLLPHDKRVNTPLGGVA